MTALSRALILAGLVAVTGTSAALAETADRNAARAQEPAYESSVSAQVFEGRAAAQERAPTQDAAQKLDRKSWLLDRRSSEYNHR